MGGVYLHVASTASTIEVMSFTLIPLARGIKEACRETVVIGTGSITVPAEAEEFVSSGACDMVSLDRTVLADPRWVTKAEKGELVVPCIRCEDTGSSYTKKSRISAGCSIPGAGLSAKETC